MLIVSESHSGVRSQSHPNQLANRFLLHLGNRVDFSDYSNIDNKREQVLCDFQSHHFPDERLNF